MTTKRMLTLVATIVMAAMPALAQPATKLAISYSATSDFLATFVAKDAGIFEKHGLDVTLSNLATTALGPPALQAGSLQIASISPPLLLLANDSGLDLVAVAAVGSLNAEHASSSFITRPGVTIAKAQDLVGLKVGRPGINSAIDMLLKKWLLDRNVAPDLVTLIETPFPQMGDRLKAGQLDAAVALEPIRSRIVASGAGTRSLDFISEVNPHIVAAIYGSTRDWATANLAAVREFRAALIEAMKFIPDNQAQTDAIQQKYLGAASAPVDLALDLKPSDFDLWIGIMKQLKLLQQPAPDATTLIVN